MGAIAAGLTPLEAAPGLYVHERAEADGPDVRYLWPPIRDFDSVVLIAPISLGPFTGPKRTRIGWT